MPVEKPQAPAIVVRLALPILVVVLAATSVPIELRSPDRGLFSFSVGFSDVVANLAGYMPIGFALATLGRRRALAAAISISAVTEIAQLVMVHREPSPVDVVANSVGAAAGIGLRSHVRIRELAVTVRGTGMAAAALALAGLTMAGLWITSGAAPNARGWTLAGGLEAAWTLDELEGRRALDSSPHHLDGIFRSTPDRVPGVEKGAVDFGGPGDYIEVANATELRLTGSMTVMAWIKPRSFPPDDAAIVSSLDEPAGYQLDVTSDEGTRTVGFKLSNACGNRMVRYGATPLAPGRWYHAAGVYDAAAQTLDVYLNGRPDNGQSFGVITGRQLSSRRSTYLGRRADRRGFAFAGALDEIRIYSRALSPEEIAASAMADHVPPDGGQVAAVQRVQQAPPRPPADPSCAIMSDEEDARVFGAIAAIGALVALAGVALWPAAARPLCVLSSLCAGVLCAAITASTVPAFGLGMIVATSLCGGVAVAVSCSRIRNDQQAASG